MLKRVPLEMIFWMAALIYLAGIDPGAEHMSVCMLKFLGVSWCPGCGIGHSISYLLHGEIVQSFQAHWLGVFAFFILLNRIIQLLKLEFKNIKFALK